VNRRGGAGSRDLAIACGLAGLGLITSIASPADWERAVAMAPLVLAVPGYAIAAALFPPGSIERADRVVYSFALSVSAAALGGLALQVALDLGRTTWLLLLVVLTLAASAVAGSRRSKLPRRAPRRPVRPPEGVLWAGALLAALAIVGAAIAIAAEGVREQQSKQRFASLWAVPAQSESGADRIEVGVWNHGGPAAYRLEASNGEGTIESLRLRLGPGRRWRARLDPPASAEDGPLLITLYHRATPYRSLELDFEGEQ
jgi:Protein of unknown function (DUF1616)